MSNVEPRFKELAECGCGLAGSVRKNGHARLCVCPPCRAGTNRRSGMRKQREARKRLGVPDARVASVLSNEEGWSHALRWEVKSGAQCGPAATRFLAAERQAEQNRRVGDSRPFGHVLMPAGWGKDGIVQVRLSVWERHIAPLIDDYGGVA